MVGLEKRRCVRQARAESEQKRCFEHLLESSIEKANDRMMRFPFFKSVF